jgi:exonuclease III
MTVLSIITCNVRGIQSIKNRETKMSALHNTSYDIICAQELRLTSQADVEDVRARWEKGTSIVSRGCDKADGVAIFFKSNAEIIKTREIIPGRILLVDCFYLNLKMRIINIYTTQDAATKVRMFKKLYELLLVGFYTVLSGDFNSYTEANDRIPVPTNPRSRNREGDALKEISVSCGVKDVFRVLHPFDVGYTRFDARIKTRIDRIYVTADITPVSYKTRVLVNSDHLAVIALLKFGKTEKKGFWKLNVNCLKNNDVITELKKRSSSHKKFKGFNQVPCGTVGSFKRTSEVFFQI